MPLKLEPTGPHSARRGDYRVAYRIDDHSYRGRRRAVEDYSDVTGRGDHDCGRQQRTGPIRLTLT